MIDTLMQIVMDDPIRAVSAMFLFAFAMGAGINIVNYLRRWWREG